MPKKNNPFETFLENLSSVPGVKVNRESFLRSAFQSKEYRWKLQEIIQIGPIEAGIPIEKIGKIADKIIAKETMWTTGISAVAGIPGGTALFATVSGDLINFYAHIFIIVQKLMYLYGWEEDIFGDSGDIDNDTMNVLIIYIGSMFGIGTASNILVKSVSVSATKMARGVIVKNFIKGGVSRTIIKKIIQAIGVKSTIKGVISVGSKSVPVVSGVLSGGVTFFTFSPMTKKLKRFLQKGQIKNIENEKDVDEILA